MKVCLFTESIDKKDGGPSRSVPILARGLAELGLDVTLMAVETDEMNTHLLDGTSVKLITVPTKTSQNGYTNLLKQGGYDIIHSQCIWVPSYHKVAVASRKLSIPLIITPRGTLEPWSLEQRKWKKKLALLLYQRNDLQKATCILATAQMEADHVRELGIKSPIAIIPNGIDISEYKCRPLSEKSTVKKQIVFLSRIHIKKGIEFLINAWQELYEKYPDWRIVIAGNGEETYIEQLKSLIKEKGVSHCINIIPPVFGDEKHKLYCESSLFVLPSFSENFGMVIAEAMSCGLPCITTTGTPWEELNEKGIGWCIELSHENLVNALTSAIKLGTDTLFDMGQRGSQHIRKTYQYTEVASKNEAVYDWIVNGKGKPNYVIL